MKESSILDYVNLRAIGQLIAESRKRLGLTLQSLASQAQVGRSTLAALEGGKLRELGFEKISRICEAVGLVLQARPMALEQPLTVHRHLTETAARELTKAAMEDVVLRGDIDSWRGLVKAIRKDSTDRLARRAREVLAGSDRSDPRVRAFSALLSPSRRPRRGPSSA